MPDHLNERFAVAIGRNLIFGIRPEHIYDQRLKDSISEPAELKSTIEVVEPIGSEVILLATCGNAQITARVDPTTRVKPQMAVNLILDMSRMHLFDADTQQAY